MQLKLPTQEDPDFVIDCASISSFFSNTSDSFHDNLFDSPIIDGDFSEYMWMENADEFDKEVMQQLEEDELMEECLEAMLDEDDEDDDDVDEDELDFNDIDSTFLTSSWSDDEEDDIVGTHLCHLLNLLRVEKEEETQYLANTSTLNPNAAEFIPQKISLSSSESNIIKQT